jgi:hypothetical protein
MKLCLARIAPVLVGAALLATAVDAAAAPKRVTKRVVAPAAPQTETTSDGGYRAKVGANLEMYLPPYFAATDGKYDVVLHFHGVAKAQESNAQAAKLNAAIVSVNLGAASDKYAYAFATPAQFDQLLVTTQKLVTASGRANGAKIGRIALSAWSAGFASVSAILKQDAARARIDAVLLADGLHAPYSDPRKHTIDDRSLGKYTRLTEEASRGEKLFVLTHSSIPTYGYATVSETVGTMLKLAAIEKAPPPASSPRNMQAIYQVNRGDLHVTGYEGKGVSDHIDHIWAMGQTMYPLLTARWKTPASAPGKTPDSA